METELRKKIHASMKEHLESKGWPDISDDAVMQEVPALWMKLLSEGLLETFIKRGFTLEHFIQIALQKKQDIAIMEWLENELGIAADFVKRNRK